MYSTESYGTNTHQHILRIHNRGAYPFSNKFFRASDCAMPHRNQMHLANYRWYRQITALSAAGKHDFRGSYNMAQPELQSALGCAFLHHHPILKESWTADAALHWPAATTSMEETLTVGCYSLRSQTACRAVKVTNQLRESQCQYRNCDGDCKGWRPPNCPILPEAVHVWLFS